MAAPQRTHYQVLGVAPSASTEDIRRAHRQLARVLHPDRQSESTPAERTLAERRMREVNAAWTELSDPTRRADYDRGLLGAAGTGSAHRSSASAGAPRTSGSPADADDPDLVRARERVAELDPDEPELSAGHFWLLRRGPIVLMVLVGLLLFVVTAYAGGNAVDDGQEGPPTSAAPLACVRNIEGRSSIWVSCQSANDGRVVTFVDQPLDCPDRTSYVVLNDRIACATKDPTLLSDIPPTTRG